MYLHNDRELFKDIITAVSDNFALSEEIIEKDYYVTMLLRELSFCKYPVVFKGGTSLSKAYAAIDRFSEDIDITFSEHLGVARRKKLKYNILFPAAKELGLEIRNFDETQSDKDYNHYDFYYSSVQNNVEKLQPYIKLETALMSYAFPVENRQINSYIADFLSKNAADLLKKYELAPFKMKVQSLERTFIDKLFAVCDYYLLKKPQRNSRHLYDIYKLSSHIQNYAAIKELAIQVKEQRAAMDSKLTPAAQNNVNIKETARMLCDSDFYKADFENSTQMLIADDVSYEKSIKRYLELIKSIF